MRELILLLLAGVSQPCESPIPGFVDAFNRGDVDRMLEHLTVDASWYYVQDGTIIPEARGHAALRESLGAYFQHYATVESSLGECLENGPYRATIETVTWLEEGTRTSQRALAVFEIDNELIQAVYYFPAVRKPPRTAPAAAPETSRDPAGPGRSR